MKHLLRSKVETYQSLGESQGSQLVLEVRGRLAWGKIRGNHKVYVRLS